MNRVGGLNRDRLRSIGRAGLWAVIGLFGSQVIGLALITPIRMFVGPLPPTLVDALFSVFAGLGLVAIAVGYLLVYDLDVGYIDVKLPGLRDLGFVVLGVVVLMGGIIAISLLFVGLGIESAQHGLVERANENNNPELLLAFVPISLLVIGPTEELVFRNVVQKSLYDRFDRRHAVVIASGLFALVHFPAYLTSTVQAALSSLFVILVLSLVLGEWYRRTENLTVVILVHGIFNAIQFSLAYVQAKYELAEATMLALM